MISEIDDINFPSENFIDTTNLIQSNISSSPDNNYNTLLNDDDIIIVDNVENENSIFGMDSIMDLQNIGTSNPSYEEHIFLEENEGLINFCRFITYVTILIILIFIYNKFMGLTDIGEPRKRPKIGYRTKTIHF